MESSTQRTILVIAGVREDGYREILGVRVGDAEHELTWEGIFSDLKDRGSVRWISLFQMDIPGSNRLPKGCSLAHHGSFVTFILSGQF